MARVLNVSENAVRRQVKALGLPLPERPPSKKKAGGPKRLKPGQSTLPKLGSLD
jgi:hypothetical protein